LLLICSLTHLRGHERFQWRHLSSAPTHSKLTVATDRNLEGHRSKMGPTLEIPQVSQKDTGTWECSVYGPEGRLGGVEYGLQITGTVSHGSVTNPFFSPCSIPCALSPLSLTSSFSPLTTWIPSCCHPALALTCSSCFSFQFPSPFSLFVQSQPCASAKSIFPSFLTMVLPHRCPGLQPSHHLQWAGYFWAHTHTLPPAYGLHSGSGPTKKGKCPSSHFCSFSCTSPLIAPSPGYPRDSSEMSQGHSSQKKNGARAAC